MCTVRGGCFVGAEDDPHAEGCGPPAGGVVTPDEGDERLHGAAGARNSTIQPRRALPRPLTRRLVICKGLGEAHGGRIRAESAGVGRGTRVSFTVPVAEAAAHGDAATGARSRSGAPRDTQGMPILVVDDDPQMLRYVRDALAAGASRRWSRAPRRTSPASWGRTVSGRPKERHSGRDVDHNL